MYFIFLVYYKVLYLISDQSTVCYDAFATYKEYQVEEKEEVFGETETALRCHICEHKINKY